MDYVDEECILSKDRGNEEEQIQEKIGGMQFLLCNGIRIFAEAFQTIENGTQSVRESCHCTGEHVLFEEASKDVSSQREFYGICRRCGMYTTPSPGTKEVGQHCSAIDFIAHEHNEGGCVPFRK